MCGIIIVGQGVAQVIISIQEELNMKLYDKNTGVVIADIITNHGMTIDEALSLMRFSIGDEGQIFDDDNGVYLDAWYDDLE